MNILLKFKKWGDKIKKYEVTTEIIVKENRVGILRVGNVNYISLTDLARQANSEDPSGVIRNWMSNKNSFDYYEIINVSVLNSFKVAKLIEPSYTEKKFNRPSFMIENFEQILL